MKKYLGMFIAVFMVTAQIQAKSSLCEPSIDFLPKKSSKSINLKLKSKPSLDSEKKATQEREVLSWETISKNSRNAVVQVFSYVNEPNIFEPYKTPNRNAFAGSAFFISKDGYLLTNYHVINCAIALYVQIPSLGKERFEVEYIGGNPDKDVALLKLKNDSLALVQKKLGKTGLSYLSLGDSDKLVEAEQIIALGYPLTQENIKTLIGCVAGRESTRIGECIQTTAPVNPGSSGGPFLDKTGNVVGICALKIQGADVDATAYLIPINNVKLMLQELYKGTLIRSPHWGIYGIPTLASTLRYLGSPEDGGVYIRKVQKGSLSAKAGMKKGDILYAVNGVKLDRFGYLMLSATGTKVSLSDFLSRIELGSDVIMTLYNNGEARDITLRAECEKDPFAIRKYFPWIEKDLDYEVILGMVFVPLLMDHIEAFQSVPGFSDFVSKYAECEKRFEPRVILSAVLPTSYIHKGRNFMNGDIVVKEINEMPIKTMDDVRAALLKNKGKEFTTLETEGGSLVALPLQEVLKEEPLLAQRYGYTLSPIYSELIA